VKRTLADRAGRKRTPRDYHGVVRNLTGGNVAPESRSGALIRHPRLRTRHPVVIASPTDALVTDSGPSTRTIQRLRVTGDHRRGTPRSKPMRRGRLRVSCCSVVGTRGITHACSPGLEVLDRLVHLACTTTEREHRVVQRLARATDAALHGADRDVEHRSDLGRAHVLPVGQLDRDLQLERDSSNASSLVVTRR